MITCEYLSVHFQISARVVQFPFCTLSQWYSVWLHMQSPPFSLTVRWVFVYYPRVAQRASWVLLHINNKRPVMCQNVNSAFPEGKCDGIWEEHLLLVSHRLQRTTRVKQGSSPRRLANTSSTAWMIWRRYAVSVSQWKTVPFPRMGLLKLLGHHIDRIIYQKFEIL